MTSSALDSALWSFGRGTGIAALSLLTLSLILGVIGRSGRPLPWMGRVGVSDLHRTAALTGTSLVGVHLVTLLLDPYSQLKVVDFAFPFLAAYRPLYLGLGTLAVDLLLLVTLVSVVRAKIGPRLFRAVHWLTYVVWPFALVHALGSGSDAGTAWFRAFAVTCLVLVVSATGWRLAPSFTGRGWDRHSRRAA
jgi:methionine sulfoxide reductase heme-binding subunit